MELKFNKGFKKQVADEEMVLPVRNKPIEFAQSCSCACVKKIKRSSEK